MSTVLQTLVDKHQGLFGTFCLLGLEAFEWLCRPPFQTMLLDAEHGVWSLPELRQALLGTHAFDIHPIVRLPVGGQWMIETLLDAGCQTLLFPMVNSVNQVEDLIQACYYPPKGTRSQSACRASTLAKNNYRQTFNEDFSLMVMIEHVHAVEVLPRMMSLGDLTGCMIGPTDLASSMGGDFDPVVLEEHIQKSLQLCKAHQKLTAITALNMQEALERISQGFDMVFVSTDRNMLLDAMDQMLRDSGHGQ